MNSYRRTPPQNTFSAFCAPDNGSCKPPAALVIYVPMCYCEHRFFLSSSDGSWRTDRGPPATAVLSFLPMPRNASGGCTSACAHLSRRGPFTWFQASDESRSTDDTRLIPTCCAGICNIETHEREARALFASFLSP